MIELPEDPRVREALALAMKRLAQRDRLTAELTGELSERGYSQSEREQVLEFLIRRRLVDDEKTIRNIIERRSGRRAAGRERLRSDLQKLGASEQAIEASLGAISDEDELEAMSQVLASRRWPEGARPKAARFLHSRGFSEELLETALDRFFGVD